MIIEAVRVGGLILTPPADIRKQLGIKQETKLVQYRWGENHLLVREGSEILLVDLTVTNGALKSEAETSSSTTQNTYTSPLALFNKADLRPNAGLYMGTTYIGKDMAVCPVGDGILVAPFADALTVYTALPGHPKFEWAETPNISPHALASSYSTWLERTGKKIATGQSKITPVPESSRGLERSVWVTVNRAIFDSASIQTT